MIEIRRAYEKNNGGYWILVDRLWPRGINKEKLAADEWIKDAAPSDKLRKWFSHDPEKWNEFKIRYRAELKNPKVLEKINSIKSLEKKKKRIVLLFGAKDEEHNQAVVLKQVLDSIKPR